MPAVTVARVASCASAFAMVLLLASCGGGDSGDGALPTSSPTRTPTATLPSLDVPSPTRSPDRTESVEVPSPTRSPDLTESVEVPSPTRSPARTESPDEPEAQPRPTSEPSAEEPVDDEGLPTWAWWLLGAVVVGSVVGIPLVLRAQRRSAWRQELATQEGELAWFARELLPGLRRAGSREQVSGGWAVGQARVSAAEDQLTVLESTAPGQADRQRARSLRDAVRHARVGIERLTGPEPTDMWALDLDAIIADLEVALRSSQTTP